VYGKEIAPTTGTPHLQGFVSCNTRVSLSQLKGWLSQQAHFEIARGSPAEAAQYCRKDGDFTEFGILPGGAGTRSDINAVQSRIRAGATRNQIRDEFFGVYARYHRAIDQYISDVQERRHWETEVKVFWGKTGTGKTRSVYEFINHDQIYAHPGGMWFDGYEGQSVALFDDFNGSEFTLSYLLKLLDRYPMKVPIKGGFVNWVPKHIFITSNKDPKTEWYPNCNEEQRRALFRRITTIQHFE